MYRLMYCKASLPKSTFKLDISNNMFELLIFASYDVCSFVILKNNTTYATRYTTYSHCYKKV